MLAKNMRNMGRKGGKLDVQFHGPYTIAEDLGKGRYRLKDEKGLELKTAYNAARLKMWLHGTKPNSHKCKFAVNYTSYWWSHD